MSENTTIKLNLKWLQQKNIVSEKDNNSDINQSEKKQEIVSPLRFNDEYKIPMIQNHKEITWYFTEKKFKKTEEVKDDTHTKEWDISTSTTNSSQKMSFHKIAWKKDEDINTIHGKNNLVSENQKNNLGVWDTSQGTDEAGKNLKWETKEEQIKFKNYKSKFKDESDNLLKHLRRFNYTPKSRIGFLISIITITSLWIWLLMTLFPEKHSLEIYTASLLDIYTWWNSVDKSEEYEWDILFTYNDMQQHSSDESEDTVDKLIQDEIQNPDNTEDINNIDQAEEEMYRIRNFLMEKYN